MTKLAIVTTHPIQYYAPIFQLLQQRGKLELMVFYTIGEEGGAPNLDPGFNKAISWDVPLLTGYPYTWIKNTAKDPGSHHFSGIKNPDLISKIKQWQPDAILVFGWSYISHLNLIYHFKNKVKIIFRGDSTLLDKQGKFRSLLRSWLLKWVYAYVDIALYVGSNNKAYFKKYGLAESQLVFAPHAIDNERFASQNNEGGRLRRSLGIGDEKTLILFAGKMIVKKSPEDLLIAYRAINNPDVHLLFVGNGPLDIQLRNKARDLKNIHFVDFKNQTQMPAVYQSCDIFCLPSAGPGETWGLAVNEAMASGKAVVVSDKVGCAADLVKDGLNGFIFTAGQPDELGEKLNYIAQDKQRIKDYGEKSVALIKDWNFNAVVTAIERTVNGK